MGQDWVKLGQNWAKLLGQNWPKDLNAIGVPIVIVETCPFGSRHRFDCYDHSQGISKVTLIFYQHPDQFVDLAGLANSDIWRSKPVQKGIDKIPPVKRIHQLPMITGTVALVDITEQSLGLPLHCVCDQN